MTKQKQIKQLKEEMIFCYDSYLKSSTDVLNGLKEIERLQKENKRLQSVLAIAFNQLGKHDSLFTN